MPDLWPSWALVPRVCSALWRWQRLRPPGQAFGKGKGKPKGKPKGDHRPRVHYRFVLETIGVLHTEEAADFGPNSTPQFILDTGATECAAGVETIQKLIAQAKLKYHIDMNDRPTFRFGDGLTLRASSRVDFEKTSLGSVSFYVLDGDFRVAHRGLQERLQLGPPERHGGHDQADQGHWSCLCVGVSSWRTALQGPRCFGDEIFSEAGRSPRAL